MNRKVFFDEVREKFFGGLIKVPQVEGIELILSEAIQRGTPRNHLAYVLATSIHETAFTMQPVREGLGVSDAWRKRHLRYYPYYGRGLTQLTWKANYQKVSEKYGVDFVSDPDLALNPQYSVKILFDGMENGWFTGKRFEDYIDSNDENDALDTEEFKRARRIINGVDRAAQIAKYAIRFEHALIMSGYEVDPEPLWDNVPDTLPAPVPTNVRREVLVIGDSIAESLKPFLGGLKYDTKVAISSGAIIDKVRSGFDILVVSAGSNDVGAKNVHASGLLTNLEKIVERANSCGIKHIIWISPALSAAREPVEKVAQSHHHDVIRFLPASDGVHPRNPGPFSNLVLGAVQNATRMLDGLEKAKPHVIPVLDAAPGVPTEEASSEETMTIWSYIWKRIVAWFGRM